MKNQTIKIVSWNINGWRAILRKNLVEVVQKLEADIYCFQEIKTSEPKIPLELINDFDFCFSCAEKKGYSGTLILWRKNLSAEPILSCDHSSFFSASTPTFSHSSLSNLSQNFPLLIQEGRICALKINDILLFNIYFPNGGMGPVRLQYKMDFYQQFLEFTTQLQTIFPKLIVCGDVNTAHQEIDLARPKANANTTGFLPAERAWIDQFLGAGWTDSWRFQHPHQIQYSWWDYKTRARDRNVGWRIDYFFITSFLHSQLLNTTIQDQILGSDHAPIILEIKTN